MNTTLKKLAGTTLLLNLLLTPIEVEGAEFDLHGFLLSSVSQRASSPRLQNGDKNNWLLKEARFRVEATAQSDSGAVGFAGKFDLLGDGVVGKGDIDMREFYFEYLADSFELRTGRQMLTWGVADRLFINDIFPKNWSAFYSGQPLEYMKEGSDMIKLSLFGNSVDSEIVFIPFAQYDITPSTDRFNLAGNRLLPVERNNKSISSNEVAIRVQKTLSSIDFVFYAFSGFWHQSDKGVAVINGTTTAIYPRLNSYGFTVQDGVMGGLLSFETAYYQSVSDNDGNNPSIANSQFRYLIAYDHEIVSDVSLGIQLYGEVMQNYAGYFESANSTYQSGKGSLPLNRHRKIGTINLKALWLNQTLTSTLFIMAVEGGGSMTNPDITYAVTDNFNINLGLHIFENGPNSWTLGMMKNDDNIYANAKWSF